MSLPAAPPTALTVPIYPQLGSPAFNQEAYSYGSSMPAVAAGMQALADNAFNNANVAVQAAAGAQTITAFKGLWSGLTGALAVPATTLHNNTYWVLLSDVANVAAETPGVSAKWAPQVLQSSAVGAANLNMLVNGGSYSVSSPTNGPVGVTDAIVNVTRASTALVQQLIDNVSGSLWIRTVKDVLTTPVYSAWGRQSMDNTPAIATTGGVMDCSKGTYFTAAISANTTLSFTNIPTGAYACVLEINHTGGVITPPSGSVYASGTAPVLYTPKRHLFYFQRAITGSGGWIISILPNAAP